MTEDKSETRQDENPYRAEPKSKSSGSCCLWGCLFMFLLLVLVVVGGGLGGYFWLKGQVNRYTADTAADLPVVELPEQELAEIEGRIDNFKETIESGEAPEDLVLTAEELNALISKDEDLRGRVFITIEEGQVAGEVSIPADVFPGGKGRFFNASATFQVSLENGVLIVTLQDAEVKGEKLPSQFIEAMSKENLAKDLYKDPEVAETLRRIDSISIEHDKIILKPRAADAGAAASAGGESASDGPDASEATAPEAAATAPGGAETASPSEAEPVTAAE